MKPSHVLVALSAIALGFAISIAPLRVHASSSIPLGDNKDGGKVETIALGDNKDGGKVEAIALGDNSRHENEKDGGK